MQVPITLPIWITDNAIIQRDQTIIIKGHYKPFSKLCLRGKTWELDLDTDEEGSFLFTLGPKKAHEVEEINFWEGRDFIHRVSNLLFGDVHLFAGQSNIEWPLVNTVEGYDEYKTPFTEEKIRSLALPKIPFEGAELVYPSFYSTRTSWQIANDKSIKSFSAIAWQTAKALFKKTGIPQGIISCFWGGTSVASWIGLDKVTAHPVLKTYTDQYEALTKSWSLAELEEHENSFKNYLEFNARYWETKAGQLAFDPCDVRSFLETDLPGADKTWPPPLGPHCFLRPGGLYETMVKKMVGLPLSSVIWYQGESDAHFGLSYESCLASLVTEWDLLFASEKPYWYIVQLPGYEYEHEGRWALTRLAQASFVRSNTRASLICAIDCGEKNNIHPYNKKVLSLRIADAILNRGKKGQNPRITMETDRLVLGFAENLRPRPELGPVPGLVLKNKHGEMIEYMTRIGKNKIELLVKKSAKQIGRIELYCDNWPVDDGKSFLYYEDDYPVEPFSINLKS